MRQLVTILLALAAVAAFPGSTGFADPAPEFQLGFQALADQIPDIVGTPLENEHYGINGDSLQQTSTGLMVWRKADNWTAFTNGYMSWINGPYGLQSRLNTDRFDWEAQANVTPLSIPDPVPPRSDVKYSFYDVRGATFREAWANAQAVGPADSNGERWPGRTIWDLRWNAVWRADGTASTIRITYSIVVTLPRWTPPAGTSPAEIDQWRSELGQLVAHENQHAQIVLDDLDPIAAAMRNARVNTAQSVFQTQLALLAQQEQALDARTDHGQY